MTVMFEIGGKWNIGEAKLEDAGSRRYHRVVKLEIEVEGSRLMQAG